MKLRSHAPPSKAAIVLRRVQVFTYPLNTGKYILVHPFFYFPHYLVFHFSSNEQMCCIQVFYDKFLVGYLLVVQMNDELLHGGIAGEEA